MLRILAFLLIFVLAGRARAQDRVAVPDTSFTPTPDWLINPDLPPPNMASKRKFEPLDARMGYRTENKLAPADLTPASAGDPLAKHYFFRKDQVKIPALARSFDQVMWIGNRTTHQGATAFQVSPNGDILTNKHVIDGLAANGGLKACVLIVNGKEISLANARVVTLNTKLDIAALQVPELAGKPYLRLAQKSDPGARHYNIGHPSMMNGTNYGKYLSAGGPTPAFRAADYEFISDAETVPGNSGGPALNQKGEVEGLIYNCGNSAFTTNSNSIRAEVLRRVLREAGVNLP